MSRHEEETAVLALLVVLLRAVRHWSQAALARASGVHRSQISDYELGRTVPSDLTLRRLAAAAGVSWLAIRRVLPALRALVRLAAARPVPAGIPGLRGLAAAVGRAADVASRQSVQPFLRERLPLLAVSAPLPPEAFPDRGADAAASGLLIVLLRSLRQWDQEELAEASGVKRSQISAYELGRKVPRERTLARLTAAVGVPLSGALDVLPVLRELVRASPRRPERLLEDLFLLEVGPFLAEHVSAFQLSVPA